MLKIVPTIIIILLGVIIALRAIKFIKRDEEVSELVAKESSSPETDSLTIPVATEDKIYRPGSMYVRQDTLFQMDQHNRVIDSHPISKTITLCGRTPEKNDITLCNDEHIHGEGHFKLEKKEDGDYRLECLQKNPVYIDGKSQRTVDIFRDGQIFRIGKNSFYAIEFRRGTIFEKEPDKAQDGAQKTIYDTPDSGSRQPELIIQELDHNEKIVQVLPVTLDEGETKQFGRADFLSEDAYMSRTMFELKKSDGEYHLKSLEMQNHVKLVENGTAAKKPEFKISKEMDVILGHTKAKFLQNKGANTKYG